MATDPICGMSVDPGPDALQLTRENRTYYFCSTSCVEQFADPAAESRRLRRRLAVAWPLSVAVILLTYATPGGWLLDVAGALALVVQVYAGAPFYAGARDAIRHRIGNMDLLIAVGTTVAFGYSVAVLAVPSRLPHETYFDASAFILTLILTGSYLEHLTRSRAGSALRKLSELLPDEAWKLDGSSERRIPASEVTVGDLLRVRPGARFPADGILRAGRTSVEESILTGESAPVPRTVGDRVIAGSINLDGVVDVEATGVGQETFLAQVGQLLNEAEMARIPLKRTADRIASVFVPVVLAIAAGAGLGWWLLRGAPPTIGLLVFVTVAVTACPCAFGIATPAALLVGTGRAAESGILFRGEDAVERAATVDLVLADKTGTLTDRAAVLTGVYALPGATEESVVALAAGLEGASDHPWARAVTMSLRARGGSPEPITDVVVEAGRGLRGQGRDGSVAILRADAGATPLPDPLARWVDSRGAEGESTSVLWRSGRPVGAVAFRAPLAAGALEAVETLRRGGIEVVMVTGDAPEVARAVAAQLGIGRVRARVSPAGKVATVEEYRRAGRSVAFVGDGVNDAAALAAADVGIAIGTGTEVAREAGQVLLVRPDLRGVPAALGIARRTVGRVRGNLSWAVAYNAVLIPIAAGALVPVLGFSVYDWLPMVGALAMGVSSTTVVLNSLTLRRTRLDLVDRAPKPAPARSAGA